MSLKAYPILSNIPIMCVNIIACNTSIPTSIEEINNIAIFKCIQMG